MRFQAIASGSNGNCAYFEDGDCRVLIDAGISCKRITDGLKKLNVDPQTIQAIFLTHEHSDHICGLPILLKNYQIPLYGTEGTLEQVKKADKKNMINPDLYHPILRDETFQVGDLSVLPITTFHDAAGPAAYRLQTENHAVALMTDTGHYDERIVGALQGLDGILLESNHDIRMLEVCSYPYVLKRRILGDYGHLSNEAAGRLLDRILSPRMKFVLLGHLSEENNYPDIALMTVKEMIDTSDSEHKSEDYDIRVAGRYESSAVYEL